MSGGMEKKEKEKKAQLHYLSALPDPPAKAIGKFLADQLQTQEKDLQYYKLKRIGKTDSRPLTGNIGIVLKKDGETDIEHLKSHNLHIEQKIQRSVGALLVYQNEISVQHSQSEKLQNELKLLKEQSRSLKEEIYTAQKEANYWKRCYEAQRWTSPRGITEDKADYEDIYFSPRESGQVKNLFIISAQFLFI